VTTAAPGPALHTIASPWLWVVTIAGVLALMVVDFVLTRRPHEVSLREALGWTACYLALPGAFAIAVWAGAGATPAAEFCTGYLLEKSLSVDNLFVFMLLLSAFAVPAVLAQRVLLYGIVGALVLRGLFVALGAGLLASLDWAFLVFGMVLLVTAAKLIRDAVRGAEEQVEIDRMRPVRLLRRLMPVTGDYRGGRLTDRVGGRRALTPLALVVAAVMTTDVLFAADSVPAVYGVTGDPYLVFATNAFALLGLRALYFVLHSALARLVHLPYGLAVILGFIGMKLILEWLHGSGVAVPEVPAAASLLVIVVTLTVVTLTSLRATARDATA
jgi:TerC family integral membrane protein